MCIYLKIIISLYPIHCLNNQRFGTKSNENSILPSANEEFFPRAPHYPGAGPAHQIQLLHWGKGAPKTMLTMPIKPWTMYPLKRQTNWVEMFSHVKTDVFWSFLVGPRKSFSNPKPLFNARGTVHLEAGQRAMEPSWNGGKNMAMCASLEPIISKTQTSEEASKFWNKTIQDAAK